MSREDLEKGEISPESVPLTSVSPDEVKPVVDDQMSDCYTKEQLLELSDSKCWNLTRKLLLGLFAVVWVAAIVWSVFIVVNSPKCAPEPEQAWFTKGAIGRIDADSLEDATAKIEQLEAGTFVGFLVGGIFPAMSGLLQTSGQDELKKTLEALQEIATLKSAKIIHKVELDEETTNSNEYEMFFANTGTLGVGDGIPTDGFVFTNVDKNKLDILRGINVTGDVFFDFSDDQTQTNQEFIYKELPGEISSSFNAAADLIDSTFSISENKTVDGSVQILWSAATESDVYMSDSVLLSGSLPGGFVFEFNSTAATNGDLGSILSDKQRTLIDLRSKKHSLRAIQGATLNISKEEMSVTRKFDLRSEVQFKKKENEEDSLLDADEYALY